MRFQRGAAYMSRRFNGLERKVTTNPPPSQPTLFARVATVLGDQKSSCCGFGSDRHRSSRALRDGASESACAVAEWS